MGTKSKKFESTAVHAMVIVGGVAADLRAKDKGMNLKGTQTDKINAENFCYNYKNYVLHPTLQFTESDADKVKRPPREVAKRLSKINPADLQNVQAQSAEQAMPVMPGAKDAGHFGAENSSIRDLNASIANQLTYDPSRPSDRPLIAEMLRQKTLARLRSFFKRSSKQHCLLFMSGHGLSGARFVINDKVSAFLSLADILRAWDASPKHEWTTQDQYGQQVSNRSHLLIVIDACKSGSWVHALQGALRRPKQDVSVQASSNIQELSYDDDSGAGGFFLNNFLFINGLKDISYNPNYRKIDPVTKQRKDVQRPSFFSKYPLLSKEFRLRIGFNSWQELEWRLSFSPTGSFTSAEGDVIKGSLKSVQLHGPGEKRLANGRVEKGVFRNDKLHGVGTIEWDSMKCHGVFDQGQLVEIYSARLSSGVEITMFDEKNEEAGSQGKRGHSLIIQDDMVKELKLMNETDQCSSVFEWGLTRFSNSDVLREMYKNGVPHGNSFYEQKEGGLVHRVFNEGILTESYAVDKEGNVEIHVNHNWDSAAAERGQVMSDGQLVDTKIKNSQRFAIFRGKLERLFPAKGLEFWQAMTFKDSGLVLAGNGYLYEGPSVNRIPQGFGKLTDPFGNYYEGFWKDGEPEGKGTFVNAVNDSMYEGLWSKGMRNGLGSMVFEDGSQYTGMWKLDLIWGQGRFVSEAMHEYEGLLFQARYGGFLNKDYPPQVDLGDRRLLNPRRQLFGLANFNRQKLPPIYPPPLPQTAAASTDANDEEGEAFDLPKQGVPNVKPREPYNFGNEKTKTYFGEIQGGFETGFGRTTTFDHEVFEGEYQGRMLLVENLHIKHYGEMWYKGSAFFYPILDFAEEDSICYKNHWTLMGYHGQGYLNVGDGETQEGEFRDGHLQGLGKHRTATGDLLEGWFDNGLLSGKGKYTTAAGQVFEGSFYEGKIILEDRKIEFSDGSSYSGSCLFKRIGPDEEPTGATLGETWAFDLFHGFGVKKEADGSVYSGSYRIGRRHGEGVLITPDKQEICGTWLKGFLKVEAQRFRLSDGSFYLGDCLMEEVRDLPEEDSEGRNRMLYQNRFVFKGREGRGTHFKPGHFLYVGEFKDDRYQGKGKLIQSTGEIYEGQFFQGRPDANGRKVYPNGDVYVGEFSGGKKNGCGIYTLPSGLQFVGEFVNDRLTILNQKVKRYDGAEYEGSCTMDRLTPEEEVQARQGLVPHCFKGAWKCAQMEGFGKLVHPDGTVYEGGFYWDQKRGLGRMMFPDGSAFQGHFENDFICGYGKYIRPDLTFIEGEFFEGKLKRGHLRIAGAGDTVFKGTILENGDFKGAEYVAQKNGDKPKDNLTKTQTTELTAAVFAFTKKTGLVARGAVVPGQTPPERYARRYSAKIDPSKQEAGKAVAVLTLPVLEGGWLNQEEADAEFHARTAWQREPPPRDPALSVTPEMANSNPLIREFDSTAAKEVADALNLGELASELGKWRQEEIPPEYFLNDEILHEEIDERCLDNWEVVENGKEENNDLSGDSSDQSKLDEVLPPSVQPALPQKEMGTINPGEGKGREESQENSVDVIDGMEAELEGENEFTDFEEVEDTDEVNGQSSPAIVTSQIEAEATKNVSDLVRSEVQVSQEASRQLPDSTRESSSPPKQSTGQTPADEDEAAPGTPSNPPETSDFAEKKRSLCLFGVPPKASSTEMESQFGEESLKMLRSVYVKEMVQEVYEGFVLDKKWHGSGKLTLPDGTVFEGNFERGTFNGCGHLVLPSGVLFKGRFVDNQPCGRGELQGVGPTPVSGYFLPSHGSPDSYQITTNSGEVLEIEVPGLTDAINNLVSASQKTPV